MKNLHVICTSVGITIVAMCVIQSVIPAQPDEAEYKRGYSHGYEAGEIDTLKELASKALRQEVKEQTWLKQGRLPEIKFEVNK